jgi:hypothetical protein
MSRRKENCMKSIPYSLIVKERHRVRHALTQILGSRDMADVALHGIRIQSRYGSCFASGAFLGYDVAYSRFIRRHGYAPIAGSSDMDKIRHNAKIMTFRMIDQMRDKGLVETTRRIRPDGNQGTNIVDFTRLWAMVYPIIQHMLQTKYWDTAKRVWKQGKDFLLIKMVGRISTYYEEIPIDMPPIPPPVEDGVKHNLDIEKVGSKPKKHTGHFPQDDKILREETTFVSVVSQ